MVSWFCLRHASKRWSFLKTTQVTVKHGPFWCHVGNHVDFTPSCIHILRWSLKHSAKRTWTGSAFSTNESAWSVMVTGSQSRVWSGPGKFPRMAPQNNTITGYLLWRFNGDISLQAALVDNSVPYLGYYKIWTSLAWSHLASIKGTIADSSIEEVRSLDVEGAKTNTSLKSNTYKRLPFTNTLLPWTVPHAIGVAGPTWRRVRCH